MPEMDKKTIYFQANEGVEEAQTLIDDLEILKQKMEKQMNIVNNTSDTNVLNGHNGAFDRTFTSFQKHMEEQQSIMNNTRSVQNMLLKYNMAAETYTLSSQKSLRNIWALRVLNIALIVMFPILTYIFMLPLFNTSVTSNASILELAVKFTPMVFVFGAIVYSCYIERSHYKRAAANKELGLKLSLLDLYLKDIPASDADMIKIELSRYLFNSINLTNK